MGVDAVPQLPSETRVAREDGRVAAQRLPEENLLRAGGVSRVDFGIAAGDAAGYRVRLGIGRRARCRVHAEDEAGDQAKGNGTNGKRARLRAPRDFLHSCLLSKKPRA